MRPKLLSDNTLHHARPALRKEPGGVAIHRKLQVLHYRVNYSSVVYGTAGSHRLLNWCLLDMITWRRLRLASQLGKPAPGVRISHVRETDAPRDWRLYQVSILRILRVRGRLGALQSAVTLSAPTSVAKMYVALRVLISIMPTSAIPRTWERSQADRLKLLLK